MTLSRNHRAKRAIMAQIVLFRLRILLAFLALGICVGRCAADDAQNDAPQASPAIRRLTNAELDRANPVQDSNGANRWRIQLPPQPRWKDYPDGRTPQFDLTSDFVMTPFENYLLGYQYGNGRFGIDQFPFPLPLKQVVIGKETGIACTQAGDEKSSAEVLIICNALDSIERNLPVTRLPPGG